MSSYGIREIDEWVSGYKVRSFPWIDAKRIYFNVQYYKPGQSVQQPPVWDKTVMLVDSETARRLLSEFTESLTEFVAGLNIEENTEVIITA